jgi:hypothetical protein
MRVILLTQISSLADLQRQRGAIIPLLETPGVSGFSVRIPARVSNPSPGDWGPLFQIAEEAGSIALAAGGKEVQLRGGMAGRWAPRHASPYWGRWPGGNLGGTDDNSPAFDYPLPFEPGGQLNVAFLSWMKEAQTQQISASSALRAKGLPVSVVHMSHAAGTWAEVFVIQQTMQYPGWSAEVMAEFYRLVVDSAADKIGSFGGQAEFALSGHEKTFSAFGPVVQGVQELAKARKPLIVINRNDIRNETKFDQMPTAYPLGWQSYAAGNTYKHPATGALVEYNWPFIFDMADLHDVVYYEAYPGNFVQSFKDAVSRYAEPEDPCAELRAEMEAMRVSLEEEIASAVLEVFTLQAELDKANRKIDAAMEVLAAESFRQLGRDGG